MDNLNEYNSLKKNNNEDEQLASSINNFKNDSFKNNSEIQLKPQQQQENMNKPCSCGGSGGAMEGSCSCKSSSDMNTRGPFVYAIGKIQPRFPTLGVEKEFAQSIGRTDTAGQTDYEAMKTVLSKKENIYLARQMCWVFTIEGIETYILKPNDSRDYDLLIESLRTPPRGIDVDVIIGIRGPIAPPTMCNGLMIPIVYFDQIYSFDVDTLMKALPKSDTRKEGKDYPTKSEEVLYRIMQMADNVGATDEHRCLNYLAVRYPGYYEKTAEMHDNDFSLSAIEVRPSRLSGSRKILDCIFTYTNRKSGVDEKWATKVDLSEEYPFLVKPLSPYYDRE